MLTYQDFRPTRRFASTISVSRDGMVAFVDDRDGAFAISTLPRGGGEPSAVPAGEVGSVHRVEWAPQGRRLAISADRGGDEKLRIYLADPDEGVVRLLAGADSVEHRLGGQPFSPDGRRVAYVANDRTSTAQDVIVADLTTGEARRIFHGTGLTRAGCWSPDGTLLAVADWPEPFARHHLYVVPADGGEARPLSGEGRATYFMGPWDPDGSGFYVRSNRGRDHTGLARMDASTGKFTWIDTPDWEVEGVAASRDGGVLVWLVNVGGASEIRALDSRTGERFCFAEIPAGVIDAYDVSADGTEVYALLSTPDRPSDLMRITRSRAQWLTDSRPAKAVPAITPQRVTITPPSGDGFDTWVYRPPAAHRPLGVAVCVHGGPSIQERPAYDDFYQYLLAAGIAVIAPNIHGSSGYGTAFEQAIYRDWGGVDLEDMAALHAWLAAQDWVDRRRIGLYGRSYGGFVVLSCITRLPHLNWAAAVDRYGISNLVTLANASPPTWRSHVATIIGDPETDREFLLSRSPLTYAADARTPMLVIQGANDPRVPRQESDQIVAALQAHGVDVTYEVIPDEGHGFRQTDTDIRLTVLAADFLIQRLADVTKGHAAVSASG